LYLKKIKSFVSAGLLFGFFSGLTSGVAALIAHEYVPQGMFRLALNNISLRVSLGTAAGAIGALFLLLMGSLLNSVWRKLITPIVHVKFTTNKLTQTWKNGLWTLALVSFSVFLFVKFYQHKLQPLYFMTGQVFILVFLVLSLFSRKTFFQRLKKPFKNALSFYVLKRTALICLVVLAVLNFWNIANRHFVQPQGPNILLVVADTLRADHLGCYGYTKSASPYIDRFAESSILFEKHFSNAPWTKPSMGTLFTSLSPRQHRVFYWADNLKNSNLSMAEVFRNKNYRTMAIQTNPSITAQYNFSQGYQDFIELPMENGSAATEEFDVWLEKNHKKPFFSYVHFMDTHMPYNALEEILRIFHLEKDNSSESIDFGTLDIRILTELGLNPEYKISLIELYDRAVRDIDRHFERLMESLSSNKVLDNTLIIFTSDHGEEFWDHGGFEHGHSLYNELMHVPLLLHFPGHLSPDRITAYTQHLDVFPTLLSLLNIRTPNTLNGEDLTPDLSNPTAGKDSVFYLESILFGEDKQGVIRNGWKLIENTTSRHSGTLTLLGDLENHRKNKPRFGYELYDLSADPSEQTNLAALHPDITSEFRKLLLKNISTEVPLFYLNKSDLEKKIEGLKSLGYIK